MKAVRIVLMLGLGLGCWMPVGAQPQKEVVKIVGKYIQKSKKWPLGWEREGGFPARVKKAVLAARVQQARSRQTQKQIRQSVFQVIMPQDGSTRGSGFVFERDGKIWGAVSYHVSGGKGNTIKMRFYREDGSPVLYYGEVAFAGSYGFNGADVALIKLPQAVREHARPLIISKEGPQKNMLVDSYGFPDEKFFPQDYSKNAGRRIFDITGYKLITTLPQKGSGNGACGGPLLNAKGEVVGIHSGSFRNTSGARLGIAVNAKTALDDLFQSMNSLENVTHPLIFNGLKITDLDITECIGFVEIKRDGEIVFSKDFRHYPGSLDINRLEKVIPAQKGDQVFLFLNRSVQDVRLEVFML